MYRIEGKFDYSLLMASIKETNVKALIVLDYATDIDLITVKCDTKPANVEDLNGIMIEWENG